MDGNENTPTATTGISPEAHNAAVSAARAEGVAAGKAEGAAEASARIKSILTCDAAKGREATAQTLALETSMSADEAAKVLASTPTNAAAPSIPPIEQRRTSLAEGGGGEFKPSAEVVKAGWAKAFAR